MIFCLAARIRLMEFLETTGRKRRYAARRSLPPAQGNERIEYHPVYLQARAECASARAKCAFGRNTGVIDAGRPWCRLDALAQMRHPALESRGCPRPLRSACADP